MQSFLLDLLFAWRTMVKNPLLTAIVVASLVMGMGANTAIFSAVNALLLRPQSFSEMSISIGDSSILLGLEQPHQIESLRTSSSLFHLLRVKAAMGRLLLPEDDKPGKEPRAVLSDTIWTGLFHADPNIVRREIRNVDGTVPVYDIRSKAGRMRGSLARQWFSMVLLGALATFALILAIGGFYGVNVL